MNDCFLGLTVSVEKHLASLLFFGLMNWLDWTVSDLDRKWSVNEWEGFSSMLCSSHIAGFLGLPVSDLIDPYLSLSLGDFKSSIDRSADEFFEDDLDEDSLISPEGPKAFSGSNFPLTKLGMELLRRWALFSAVCTRGLARIMTGEDSGECSSMVGERLVVSISVPTSSSIRLFLKERTC